MYNKKVMELFQNPENCGLLHSANAISVVNHEEFGDVIKFYMRVDDNGVIEDASFKAFGTPALIAVTSIVAGLVKGKTPEQAQEISNEDILNLLEDLPQARTYCLDFARHAVNETIADYYDRLEKEEKRQNKKNKKAMLADNAEMQEESQVEVKDEELNNTSLNEEVQDVQTLTEQGQIKENEDFNDFDEDDLDEYDDEDIQDEIQGDGITELYNKIFNSEDDEQK